MTAAAAGPRPAAIAFTPAMRVLIDAMGALIAIPAGHDHWPQLIAVLAEVLPQVRATGEPAPDALIRAAVQLQGAEPARRRWMARVGATDGDRQSAGEVALAGPRGAVAVAKAVERIGAVLG